MELIDVLKVRFNLSSQLCRLQPTWTLRHVLWAAREAALTSESAYSHSNTSVQLALSSLGLFFFCLFGLILYDMINTQILALLRETWVSIISRCVKVLSIKC